ncbi:type IV pilus modification PilV family protein [Candidatus Uabimicrobium amorphum]|uniref:Uncharacterized protein n=1 Tax=Uabimicrobium amorphum TaxID=2596890 RepID=A0A5S9F2Z1_UABAM|nr:pilus assembly PilX N-terminal domain-containing protein [Candidatus Uabimicrobium amorphum]BBM83948.1 hypothetical protein UABAM_02303 [Candidatus Uabimicrobium amorphum]
MLFKKNNKGSTLIIVLIMVILTTALLYGLITLAVFNNRKSNISIENQALFYHAQSGLERLKAIIEAQQQGSNQAQSFDFIEDWANELENDSEPFLTFRGTGNNRFEFVDLQNGNKQSGGGIQNFYVQGDVAEEKPARIYLSIKKLNGSPNFFILEARAWRNNRETKVATVTSVQGLPLTQFARFLSEGSLNPNSSKASYDGQLFVGGTLSHTTSGGKNHNRYFDRVFFGDNWISPEQSGINVDVAGGPYFFNGEPEQSPQDNPVEDLTNSIAGIGAGLPNNDQNFKFDYVADDTLNNSEKGTQSSLWNFYNDVSSGDVEMFRVTGDTKQDGGAPIDFNSLTPAQQDLLRPTNNFTEQNASGETQLPLSSQIDTKMKFYLDQSQSAEQRLRVDIEVTYRSRAGGSFSRIKLRKTNVEVKNDSTFFTRGNSNVRGFYDRRLSVVSTNVANVTGPIIAMNSDGDKRFAVTQVEAESNSPTAALLPLRDNNNKINFIDPVPDVDNSQAQNIRGKDWVGFPDGQGKRFMYMDKLSKNDDDHTYWTPSQIGGESVVPSFGVIAQEQVLLRQPEDFTTDVPNHFKYAQNPEYHVVFVVADGEVHSHEGQNLSVTSSSNNPTPGFGSFSGIDLWPNTVRSSNGSNQGNRNNFLLYGTLVTRGGCLFHSKKKSSLIAYDDRLRQIGPPNVPVLSGTDIAFGSWAVLTNFRANENPEADFSPIQ